MSAKQITVPLEVYVRLQELASLAGYSYREAEEGTERTWDLANDEGASLLDERGAIRPEAAELYFTLMPLIAHEFVQQQQALVEAYRKTPKPAAARAKIRPSNQRLIPLTEVPLENQRIAARIEQEFYGEVPESRRIYGVLPGVMDYMMRHDLGYALLLEIIESPKSVVREETAEENRYGREVTLYTHEVLALRPLKASAGGYQLSLEAQSQLKALGLTSEYITRILDEADNRQPIPGTSRTVYSLNGYQVEFSHSDQQVIRIARGVAANRNPFESQPRMSGRKRQRGRKIPHDVDEFVQLLQEHGFTVTMGGKHYDIRHEALAPGQKAVTSVTPSDSQRWHLNSARQIRNTFGVDLRYADPRDSVRGIVRGTRPAKDALPAEGSAPDDGKQPADSVS